MSLPPGAGPDVCEDDAGEDDADEDDAGEDDDGLPEIETESLLWEADMSSSEIYPRRAINKLGGDCVALNRAKYQKKRIQRQAQKRRARSLAEILFLSSKN
ncbi:MAG: hypothetical protein AB7U82_19150 [Blastocatellales bacterium]